MTSQVTLRRRWAGPAWAALALAAMLTHTWQIFSLFPSVSAIVDERPVVAVDHALHLYHGYLGARAIRSRGMVCGYDPAFMAGYRRTPLFDPSANLAELSQLLYDVVNPAAYKVTVCVTMLAVPLLVGAATWIIRRNVSAAALAISLAVLYWWVGYPNGLLRSGLVAFLWSSGLSTLLVGALVTHDGQWTVRRWLLLWLLGAAGLQAHPTFAVQCLPVCLIWVFTRGRRSIRWWVGTVSCVLAAVAVSSPWLVPLASHLRGWSASAPFLQARDPRFVVDYWMGDWSYRADAHIPTVVLLWLLSGLLCRWSAARGMWLLGGHLACLAFLTFAGSLLPGVRSLEPLRFQVPMVLGLICLCAAVWLNGTASCFGSTSRFKVGIVGLCVLATAWLVIRATAPAAYVRLTMRRPLPLGIPSEARALVAMLERHTTPDRRILLEDQLRLWEPTDPESTHWTPLLPLLIDRSFIGGLYELAPLPHNYASFGDFHLAGRRIDRWSYEELREFLRLYNVGWVVTWSRRTRADEPPRATEVFAAAPFCRPLLTVPRYSSRPSESIYTLFEVTFETDWAVEGHAKLERAGFDTITFKDLNPPRNGGPLVLSLHYDPGLVPRERVKLEPVRVGKDPVPFLAVRAGRPLAELHLQFRWPRFR